MWPQPRLADLITAHLDTSLIPSGLSNTSLSDGGKKAPKESKERTKKDIKKRLRLIWSLMVQSRGNVCLLIGWIQDIWHSWLWH